jgi:hypothetical protein
VVLGIDGAIPVYIVVSYEGVLQEVRDADFERLFEMKQEVVNLCGWSGLSLGSTDII